MLHLPVSAPGPAFSPEFPRNRRHTSACLLSLEHDLRHDQAVGNGKTDGMGPWLRISGWLPPGLALGWLAVVATFIHGVSRALTAWAATVSLVILLARRRPAVSSTNPPKAEGGLTESSVPASHDSAAPTSLTGPRPAPAPPASEEGTAGSTALPADATEKTATSASLSPDFISEPGSRAKPVPGEEALRPMPDATDSGMVGQAEQLGTAETVEAAGMRVLTAAEVASMLRVDANVIITAISIGELPGNRVGSHWRVDQGALTRWLQGTYGSPANPGGSPSPTEHTTDPT